MRVSMGRAGAGCRALGAGVLLLVGVSAQGQAAESHPWWPDPDTGLMWSQITAPRAYVDYDHAVSGCEQSFDGYSGWRLPTEDEFTPVTVTTQVMNYAITETGPPGFRSKSPDFDQPVGQVPELHLKFLPNDSEGYWTSTHGKVEQDMWVMDYPGPAHSRDARPKASHFAVMCVRQMEPDLLALAKQAHPATAVSGVVELKSIVPLLASEAAIKATQFQAAIDDAKQALAIYPESVRAYEDMANAYGYLGQWDQDVKTLEAGLTVIKKSGELQSSLNVAKTSQKQAAKDKNFTPAWVLLLKADTALDDKRYRDAVDAATQVTQMEPKWEGGFKDLGYAEFDLKQWAPAIAALKVAAKIAKHDADEVYSLQGKMNDAKKQQKKAAQAAKQ